MTEKEAVGPLMAETIAELSRRPTMEQYAIVVGERDMLALKVEKLAQEGSYIRDHIATLAILASYFW